MDSTYIKSHLFTDKLAARQLDFQQGKFVVYLAGKIPKANEPLDNNLHWTQDRIEYLKSKLIGLNVVFLNPAFKDGNPSDQQSVFGRDICYVSSSHLVFVDAREGRGLGVGAEMMWAKINGIAVITLAPINSHYNNSSIHPFINCLSDQVVENIEEGASWIKKFFSNSNLNRIKDHKYVYDMINKYNCLE